MASCCPFIYLGRAGHNITSEPDIQTSMTTSFFHRRCGQLRLCYKILPASRKPNSCISRPRATKTTNEARSRARSIPYLCLGQCCSLQCLSVLVHTDNEIKNESRLTQAYLCNVVQTCIRKIPGIGLQIMIEVRLNSSYALHNPSECRLFICVRKLDHVSYKEAEYVPNHLSEDETGACCLLIGCNDQITIYFPLFATNYAVERLFGTSSMYLRVYEFSLLCYSVCRIIMFLSCEKESVCLTFRACVWPTNDVKNMSKEEIKTSGYHLRYPTR